MPNRVMCDDVISHMEKAMVLLKAAYADVVWIASHTVNKDAKEAQQELMCAKEHLAIAIDIARLEQ